MMKLANYLKEDRYKVIFLKEMKEIWGYAGRNISQGNKTYVWIYIAEPELRGLVWSDPHGNVYQNDAKVAKIEGYSDTKITHKQVVAKAYPFLDIKITGNLRNDVDEIVDKYEARNVRGRVLGDTCYIYPANMMSPFDEKRYHYFAKKAMSLVIRYIGSRVDDI